MLTESEEFAIATPPFGGLTRLALAFGLATIVAG